MILGLLLGNSTLRLGVLDGRRVVAAESVPWNVWYANEPTEASLQGRDRLARILEQFVASDAIAGSVRDERLASVEEALPPELHPLKLARRDFPIPIENRYERPEDAGTDRLLNALAARERAGTQGAIVVDFGTAISVSVVSADGAFLGGLITAGADAISKGLATATPRLPRVAAKSLGGFLQTDTMDALSAGTFWQVVGGIRTMLEGIDAELPVTPRVFATGGDATRFASQLPRIDEVVPELTLEGLALAWAARSIV